MFPDRSEAILIHRSRAKEAVRRNDFDQARQSFFQYVESVRQQNINSGGKLEKELDAAKKEYSDFVKTDPFYIRMLTMVTEEIRKNPGLLQTELYKLFPDDSRESLRYVLYFADDHGYISRTKKGRSYELNCVGENG